MDHTALVPSGDDDLAKLVLKRPPAGLFASGKISLYLSDNSAVRIFDNNGKAIYDPSSFLSSSLKHTALELDLAHPQGPLAGLLTGDVTLWVEGLNTNLDFALTLQEDAWSGISPGTAIDDVHAKITNKMNLVIDSDNNNGQNIPDDSGAEARVKNTGPGKFITVNNNDDIPGLSVIVCGIARTTGSGSISHPSQQRTDGENSIRAHPAALGGDRVLRRGHRKA